MLHIESQPHQYTEAEIARMDAEDEHYANVMRRFEHYCHRCAVKQRVRYGAYIVAIPAGWWTIVSIFA